MSARRERSPAWVLPPDLNDMDVLSAALAYIEVGLFVFPTKGERGGDRHKEWKEPLTGCRWSEESTRDPRQAIAWFAGTSGLGIGIDCGKSGLVVLDEDHAGVLPAQYTPPTLVNRTGRGRHFIYTSPPGRRIGNGLGKLPKGFGDIRGDGGYIVAAPSPHSPGVRYQLEDVTVAPAPLPDVVAELLPDRGNTAGAVTSAEVAAFIAEHNTATRPNLLGAVLRKAQRDVDDGANRHPTAVSATVWAMREAKAGLYAASTAVSRVGRWFAKVADDRDTSEEFAAIVRWAVAQVAGDDPDTVRREVAERVPPGTIADLWPALDAYLEAYDPLPVLVTLATAATSTLKGEPLWTLLVGAPSSGKTEAVRLVEPVAEESIAELTGSAALLSWTKGKNPRPCGMLARIGSGVSATACIRDLSPLLASSDRGGRDEVYSKLRDVYDGRCRREVGQNPEPLEWTGRLTVVAAVTPAIDNYASHAQALGDRWLYLRLTE